MEEKPHLLSLLADGVKFFREEVRTVDDRGLVQVAGLYYAILPARIASTVQARIYKKKIEIFEKRTILSRHGLGSKRGQFKLGEGDRMFNSCLQTLWLIERAERQGPSTGDLARNVFAKFDRSRAMADFIQRSQSIS